MVWFFSHLGSLSQFPVWSAMTSWHTCLGSSLAAHHSSRFVTLWWTKHAFWLLWVLVLCSFISSSVACHGSEASLQIKLGVFHSLWGCKVKWAISDQGVSVSFWPNSYLLVVGTNLYLPQQFTSEERLHRCEVVCRDVQSVITPSLSPWQLSPKKTWEGFIGGFFATVLFGLLVSSNHSAYFIGLFPS